MNRFVGGILVPFLSAGCAVFPAPPGRASRLAPAPSHAPPTVAGEPAPSLRTVDALDPGAAPEPAPPAAPETAPRLSYRDRDADGAPRFVEAFHTPPAPTVRRVRLDFQYARDTETGGRRDNFHFFADLELGWDFLGLGVRVPFTVDRRSFINQAIGQVVTVTDYGLNDLEFLVKVVVIESRRFVLAVVAEATVPPHEVGNGIGRNSFTARPAVRAWWDVGNHVQVQGEIGAEIPLHSRPPPRFNTNGVPSEFRDVFFWSLALTGTRPAGRRRDSAFFTPVFELYGSVPFNGRLDDRPTLATLIGIRFEPAPGVDTGPYVSAPLIAPAAFHVLAGWSANIHF
jgi:hypothetical protein